MKQFVVMLLTVFGLMFATSVVAETYTVISGDTLSKIAEQYQGVSWQDIYYANKQKIKNPDRIYPRQKLDIPVGSKESLTVYYNNPDSNPVGRGTDPVPYIKKAHLPKDVEEQFIAWAFSVGKDTLANAIITRFGNPKVAKGKKVFPHFDTMGYGKNGNVLRNVEATFDDIRLAKYWSIVRGTTRYYLICDLKCYNWSTFSEKIVPIKTGPIGPIVIAKKPKVRVEKKQPKKIDKVTDLKTRWINYKPIVSTDSWFYGGYEKGIQKNSRGFAGWWAGGNLSVFPGEFQGKKGITRIGPHVATTHWGGKFDYDGRYDGYEALGGMEAQYEQSNNKTEVIVAFGKHSGNARISKYRNHEGANLTLIDIAHTRWNKDWEFGIGARAKLARHNTKTSFWDGNPIASSDDPPTDQTAYLAWVEITRKKWKNFKPTLSVDIGYRTTGKFNSRIQPGAKVWHDVFEPQIFYDIKEGPKNDTMGAALNIDITQLVRVLKNMNSQKSNFSKKKVSQSSLADDYDWDGEDYD